MNGQGIFMTDKKMPGALPSRVILSADKSLLLDTAASPKASEIRNHLCQNLSLRMSTYYSAHPEAWKSFLECMAE